MILNPSGAETRRQHSGIVETNRSSARSRNGAHQLGAHPKKKADGYYTVGFFLRLLARYLVPSRVLTGRAVVNEK